MFCDLHVGEQYINKARILVAKKGTKLIIEREWLSMLRYKFTPVIEGEWEVDSVKKDEELSAGAKQLVVNFQNCSEEKEESKITK